MNLEQRINIKLAPLTLAYGEYAMKILNGIGGSRKGEKMCKMTQEVGSQKRKGQMQTWTGYEPWCAQIEDYMLLGRLTRLRESVCRKRPKWA
jgi:hypothetical protein